MSSEAVAPRETPQDWPLLSMVERRILGVMVEKAKTTPDVYPLSVNSLVTGCNQKSNRDPMMNVNEDEVEETLVAMQHKGHVTKLTGGRVVRWRHNLYDLWQVDKVELAILAELLLRGPQTEGELRSRASRMEPLDELEQLRQALRPLAQRKLVVFLGPEGRRGTLITHGFHAVPELAALQSRSRAEEASSSAPSMEARKYASVEQFTALQTELGKARDELAALAEQVRQLQENLKSIKDSLGA